MSDDSTPSPSPSPPPLQPDPTRPPEGFEALEGGVAVPNIVNKLLKKPLALVFHLDREEAGGMLPVRLLAVAIGCLVVFGIVVGTFSGSAQLWAAPLKIVCGLLFSGLICLPSLYIFSCLGGLNAKFGTVVGLLCALTALAALLLVGFAPVVWLFGVSSTSAAFLGFLLLTLWIICVSFGFVLLFRAGRALGMTTTGHLLVWCVVFLLVTLQMTTTLRPILGTSDRLLNFDEKKFFLSHWSDQLSGRTTSRPSESRETP